MNPRRSPRSKLTKFPSPLKRRLFFAFTISVPLLIFVFLEVSLRLLSYGMNLSLFTTESISGKTYHIMNPDVKGRYFSRVEFSPNTSPDYFQVPKPEGTKRIFCLGGSTTVGYPYSYVGSFSTFLRDRLRVSFPDKNIEVINLGMTATNSYTVVDIARELVDYEPDLFVVYDGHNEFYGALGIASHESLGSARWLAKLYLHLVHFRTFQLIRDLYMGISGIFAGSSDASQTGTMMERLARGQYILYGGDTYTNGLEIFKDNLSEFVGLCRAHNIPAILAPQVSNLRDLPPFVSGGSSDNNLELRARFNSSYNNGLASWMDGRFEEALASFQDAIRVDSMRADAYYQAALCLDTLGRKREALDNYVEARNLDMLRFRAHSEFNNAIREVCDNKTIFFADIERKFAANSPDSIVGYNLILEHLHPNARGYFLMAKEYMYVMMTNSLIATAEEWQNHPLLDDDRLFRQKPITELDEICAQRRTEILISGWPFTPVEVEIPPVPPHNAIARIADQMVRGEITWEQGHVMAASHYESAGDFQKAEREYLAIINQIPLNVSPYLALGQLYLRQRRIDDAFTLLYYSTRIERSFFAFKTIGTIAYDGGMTAEAIEFLEQGLALARTDNDRAEMAYLLGLAYGRSGKKEQAIMSLQQALRFRPGFKAASELLRNLQGQ